MEYAYPCGEIPEPLEGLVTLALDLRWTWCREGDGLWRSLDPQLWERTGNPWRVLQNVSGQTGELGVTVWLVQAGVQALVILVSLAVFRPRVYNNRA